MITALAGGVGAARFLTGLLKLVPQEDLSVIVNTGDDIELHGLHVSPDIDIVTYTLAGIINEEKGWGIKSDTFQCLEMLKRFNQETWFALGDRDLATSIFRTELLKSGFTLSQVTSKISRDLGLSLKILPMTDDKFETRILTDAGSLHFQEFLVKRGAKDKVIGVEFIGATEAKPALGVIESIKRSDLIVICPSNPIVSIGTILSVNGVRDALKEVKARKVAISPLIAGAPVKGPLDKLFLGLGFEVSGLSVAKIYSDFLDTFIIDTVDVADKSEIEKLGVKVKVTNTLMKNLECKIDLAKAVLEENR